MKTDMGGAAAVIGAMSALKDLGVKTKVIAFTPMVENMPSGTAIRPGDVLKIRNGKTVEVLNTDAEGRLILADGLSLAVEEKPDAIVDLATLTGACVVALGEKIAGLMTSNDGWGEQVRAAADRAGEEVWPLPLPDEYNKLIESEVADLKNIGSGGYGGALTAGLFLAGVRRRRAVGAPRHRRPGPGRLGRRRLRARRHRLRRPHPRRAAEHVQEAGDQRQGAVDRSRRVRLLGAVAIVGARVVALLVLLAPPATSASARGVRRRRRTRASSRSAMKDNVYLPQTLTVDPGTLVVWENEGRSKHNVIPDKAATGWKSKTIQPGPLVRAAARRRPGRSGTSAPSTARRARACTARSS